LNKILYLLSPAPRAGWTYLSVDLGFRCASSQGGVEHLGWGARLYAVARYRGLVDGSARAALLVDNKHILKELWQAAKKQT